VLQDRWLLKRIRNVESCHQRNYTPKNRVPVRKPTHLALARRVGQPMMVVPCRLGLSLPRTANPQPSSCLWFLHYPEFQYPGRYTRLFDNWSVVFLPITLVNNDIYEGHPSLYFSCKVFGEPSYCSTHRKDGREQRWRSSMLAAMFREASFMLTNKTWAV